MTNDNLKIQTAIASKFRKAEFSGHHDQVLSNYLDQYLDIGNIAQLTQQERILHLGAIFSESAKLFLI